MGAGTHADASTQLTGPCYQPFRESLGREFPEGLAPIITLGSPIMFGNKLETGVVKIAAILLYLRYTVHGLDVVLPLPGISIPLMGERSQPASEGHQIVPGIIGTFLTTTTMHESSSTSREDQLQVAMSERSPSPRHCKSPYRQC